MNNITIAAEALRALRECLGVGVIWKTTTMWNAGKTAFTEDLYHHCSPFCRAVKRICGAGCNREESPERLIQPPPPAGFLVKSCHAGAIELVVPIRADGVVLGVLLAGPFRPPHRVCPVAAAAAAYNRLPLYRPAHNDRLCALLQLAAAGLVQLSLRPEQPADARIAQALDYLQAHFREPHRVEAVAARCALSASRFAHLFTEQTGLTFATYLMHLRLNEAKHLLADAQHSKADIAARTGFCDQSHFSSAFRQHTGMSPGRYQKWLRAQHSLTGAQ